jgi:hypothetical protein
VAIYMVRNPDKLRHLRFPTRIDAAAPDHDKIAPAEALTPCAIEAPEGRASALDLDGAQLPHGVFRH